MPLWVVFWASVRGRGKALHNNKIGVFCASARGAMGRGGRVGGRGVGGRGVGTRASPACIVEEVLELAKLVVFWVSARGWLGAGEACGLRWREGWGGGYWGRGKGGRPRSNKIGCLLGFG